MTEIHATGVSEMHYQAERAIITARVSVTSTDRSRSIAAATELHNQVAARAQQLRNSGDATWHAAHPISTYARKTYAEGSKQQVIIEHVTSSRVQMKLSNFSLVSAVVAELAEAGVETGVEWALTDASRRTHERAGRKHAVAAARVIADDYAEALGERVVRVLRVSDEQQYGGPQVRAMAASMPEQTAEVTIAEITVRTAIAGVFESA